MHFATFVGKYNGNFDPESCTDGWHMTLIDDFNLTYIYACCARFNVQDHGFKIINRH